MPCYLIDPGAMCLRVGKDKSNQVPTNWRQSHTMWPLLAQRGGRTARSFCALHCALLVSGNLRKLGLHRMVSSPLSVDLTRGMGSGKPPVECKAPPVIGTIDCLLF